MDTKYACYCGNYAVKVKIEPASKVLYEEMEKAGFGFTYTENGNE